MSNKVIMLKPVSSQCNMDCSYCFYRDLVEQRNDEKIHKINFDIIKKLLEEVFQDTSLNTISFVFQGGEPLLAGLDYYRDFVNYVNKIKGRKLVRYSLQTNGSLINEEFCKFFKENNFLIGISIDGFRSNHDKFRKLSNRDSFLEIIKGLNLINKFKINFNVLTVLTNELSQYPSKLMQFYREYNISNIQIIPCLGLSDLEKQLYNSSCTPENFKKFYTSFYYEWKSDLENGYYRNILLFSDMITAFLGGYPQQCGFLGNCQEQLVIEANGDLYPCDFYATQEHYIGNLENHHIDDLLKMPKMLEFRRDSIEVDSPICQKCYFRNLCNGGCKRLRQTYLDKNDCGLKPIFHLIYNELPEIVNLMKNNTINKIKLERKF